MSIFSSDNRYRTPVLVVAVGVALVAIYQLVLWSSHLGKTPLTLVTVPSDSSITLDGEAAEAGTHYVEPGRHEVSASKEHFGTVKRSVDIKSSEPQTINLLPKIDSDEASSYFADNPGETVEREKIGSEEFQKTSDIIGEKYPYISQLPIITSSFAVYQRSPISSKVADGDAAIALEVSATHPLDRARAVDRIRTELGIDPSGVEIVFENMPNIFAGENN